MRQRHRIGQLARIIGMPGDRQIVGTAWRSGGIVYALQGIAGVWPSWLVEAA